MKNPPFLPADLKNHTLWAHWVETPQINLNIKPLPLHDVKLALAVPATARINQNVNRVRARARLHHRARARPAQVAQNVGATPQARVRAIARRARARAIARRVPARAPLDVRLRARALRAVALIRAHLHLLSPTTPISS